MLLLMTRYNNIHIHVVTVHEWEAIMALHYHVTMHARQSAAVCEVLGYCVITRFQNIVPNE